MKTKLMLSIARQSSVFYFLLLATSAHADSLFNLRVTKIIRNPVSDSPYGNTVVIAKDATSTKAIYFNGKCGGTAQAALMSSKSISFNVLNVNKLPPYYSHNGHDTYAFSADDYENCRVHE